MAKARILDVGQCDPDHAGIRRMIEANFDAEVHRVMFIAEARAALARQRYDLVLVNRLVFADGSDGLELVRAVRADATTADIPIMMISNYDEAQQRAVEAGAVPGFGKAALSLPATIERVAKYVPAKNFQPSESE